MLPGSAPPLVVSLSAKTGPPGEEIAGEVPTRLGRFFKPTRCTCDANLFTLPKRDASVYSGGHFASLQGDSACKYFATSPSRPPCCVHGWEQQAPRAGHRSRISPEPISGLFCNSGMAESWC